MPESMETTEQTDRQREGERVKHVVNKTNGSSFYFCLLPPLPYRKVSNSRNAKNNN